MNYSCVYIIKESYKIIKILVDEDFRDVYIGSSYTPVNAGHIYSINFFVLLFQFKSESMNISKNTHTGNGKAVYINIVCI